jgi:hypothetical protein
MKIKFLFAWYDLWIGLFWDSKKKWLYILPIPMFGIIIQMIPEGYRINRVETHWLETGIGNGYMALHDTVRIGVFKTRWKAMRGIWRYRKTL